MSIQSEKSILKIILKISQGFLLSEITKLLLRLMSKVYGAVIQGFKLFFLPITNFQPLHSNIWKRKLQKLYHETARIGSPAIKMLLSRPNT